MKLQCDVCSNAEASVFCCADEAALCAACDRKVHGANRLASKHRRLSLSSPAAKPHPNCDICQEKRGYVFCQQDRAILCHDCDDNIHSANELTKKHDRFLLTGVRVSSEPIADTEEPAEIIPTNSDQVSSDICAASKGSENSSSISDYLINMLPGYCVEDLIIDDAVAAAKDAFFKSNDLMEELPIWVPQTDIFNGNGFVQDFQLQERWTDNSFMVPQISNNTTELMKSNKRQRMISPSWDF